MMAEGMLVVANNASYTAAAAAACWSGCLDVQRGGKAVVQFTVFILVLQ